MVRRILGFRQNLATIWLNLLSLVDIWSSNPRKILRAGSQSPKVIRIQVERRSFGGSLLRGCGLMNQSSQETQVERGARKPYSRPNLRRVGNFKDLTRTDSNTQYQIDTRTGSYQMS